MNNTNNTYRSRAICSCGYKGRWFINPNDADAAAENHSGKYDTYQGGKSDGRKHIADVEEAAKLVHDFKPSN